MRLPPCPDADPAGWFAAVAAALLNRAELVVAGEPMRVAEVEFYMKCAAHPDPFAHAHPVQRGSGVWYFHRAGAASFRGGSFKGLDLALGDAHAAVGVLLRSVVLPDGTLIDGPSRLVDHLLRTTGAATVADLDARLPAAFDPTLPIHLRETADRGAEVTATARVGLSLRRAAAFPQMPRYVGRRYRFLTEPRRVRAGRPQLVAALHGDGVTDLRARTGIAAGVAARYAAAFDAGRAAPDFARHVGAALGPLDRCRLLGTWAAEYGAG